MNIRRIIKEEIDSFDWVGEIEPSNIEVIKHILDNSDYEVLPKFLNRFPIMYYGKHLTAFRADEDIDGWMKTMEKDMDDVVGDKYEDAYMELYELLDEYRKRVDR
jgi:hypothetical protein